MPILIVSPNGAITRKSTLALAVAGLDSAKKTIVVTSNQSVNTLTIPANVELQIKNGAVITVNSGNTMTILGEFQKPTYSCFAGTGVVVIPTGGPGSQQNFSAGTVTGDIVTGVINELQGTSIASATDINLGTATGNYIKITGTLPIFSLGTIAAGVRRIVEFTDVLILKHNATSLILPGGTDIVTKAGDNATFVSLGSGNWKCIEYTRQDGSSIVVDPNKVAEIQNGSFEVDADSLPVDWSWIPYPNGTYGIDTTTPAHGAKAFKVTRTLGIGNGGGILSSNYVACSELMPVYLGFIHWASNATMKNNVVIRFFTSAIETAVTFQDTGDTVTLNNHGYMDGDEIQFSSIVSTTGINTNTTYYVINATTNTFKLTTTRWATAMPLSVDGSGTISTPYAVKSSAGAAQTLYTSTANPTSATYYVTGFTPIAGAKFYKVELVSGYTDTNVAGTAYWDAVGEVGVVPMMTSRTTPISISECSTDSHYDYVEVASASLKLTAIGFPTVFSVVGSLRATGGGSGAAYMKFRIGSDYSAAYYTNSTTYVNNTFTLITTTTDYTVTIYMLLQGCDVYPYLAFGKVNTGTATYRLSL